MAIETRLALTIPKSALPGEMRNRRINSQFSESLRLHTSREGIRGKYPSDIFSSTRIRQEMDLKIHLKKRKADVSKLANYLFSDVMYVQQLASTLAQEQHVMGLQALEIYASILIQSAYRCYKARFQLSRLKAGRFVCAWMYFRWFYRRLIRARRRIRRCVRAFMRLKNFSVRARRNVATRKIIRLIFLHVLNKRRKKKLIYLRIVFHCVSHCVFSGFVRAQARAVFIRQFVYNLIYDALKARVELMRPMTAPPLGLKVAATLPPRPRSEQMNKLAYYANRSFSSEARPKKKNSIVDHSNNLAKIFSQLQAGKTSFHAEDSSGKYSKATPSRRSIEPLSSSTRTQRTASMTKEGPTADVPTIAAAESIQSKFLQTVATSLEHLEEMPVQAITRDPFSNESRPPPPFADQEAKSIPPSNDSKTSVKIEPKPPEKHPSHNHSTKGPSPRLKKPLRGAEATEVIPRRDTHEAVIRERRLSSQSKRRRPSVLGKGHTSTETRKVARIPLLPTEQGRRSSSHQKQRISMANGRRHSKKSSAEGDAKTSRPFRSRKRVELFSDTSSESSFYTTAFGDNCFLEGSFDEISPKSLEDTFPHTDSSLVDTSDFKILKMDGDEPGHAHLTAALPLEASITQLSVSPVLRKAGSVSVWEEEYLDCSFESESATAQNTKEESLITLAPPVMEHARESNPSPDTLPTSVVEVSEPVQQSSTDCPEKSAKKYKPRAVALSRAEPKTIEEIQALLFAPPDLVEADFGSIDLKGSAAPWVATPPSMPPPSRERSARSRRRESYVITD